MSGKLDIYVNFVKSLVVPGCDYDICLYNTPEWKVEYPVICAPEPIHTVIFEFHESKIALKYSIDGIHDRSCSYADFSKDDYAAIRSMINEFNEHIRYQQAEIGAKNISSG